MPKKIEPQLKKVGDYLKLDDNAIFIIPEYQRAYSWGIANCDKLWQDIVDFVDSENSDNYFFGTIIINCREEDKELDLIDGQQRTTTFLLLLKALLVKINDFLLENPVYNKKTELVIRDLRYRRQQIMMILYKALAREISENPETEVDGEIYHRDTLIRNLSINEKHKNELKTILQAIDFKDAKEHVYQIPYKQKDNRYTNFFRNFQFFYKKVCEIGDIRLPLFAETILEKCQVIEIRSWNVEQAIKMFNSLNSDGLPLYDSDIISAMLYAESKKRNSQEEFSALWKQLRVQIDDLEAAGVADINSILMQYMYYLRAKKGETVNEKGAIDVTTPGLRRFFLDENQEPIQQPIQTCNKLLDLVSIWKTISKKTLVKLLLKSNENSKLFLASFFFRTTPESLDDQDLSVILECLLRLFTILELVDAGYSSKNFKTFLFGEQVKFYDNRIAPCQIEDDFDKHIHDTWEKEAIIEALNDYNGNLLVYLNEYLFAKERGQILFLGDNYDIEHIMPQSGNNLPMIREDAGILNEEDFDATVNKLGNKMLLEKKINRSIGNEWFRTKVTTKLENKTGYVDSSYPIARSLVQNYKDVPKPMWTKESILNATKEASQRIANFIFNETNHTTTNGEEQE